jgi:hypothetical protein
MSRGHSRRSEISARRSCRNLRRARPASATVADARNMPQNGAADGSLDWGGAMSDGTVSPEKPVSRAAIRIARSRQTQAPLPLRDDRGHRPTRSGATQWFYRRRPLGLPLWELVHRGKLLIEVSCSVHLMLARSRATTPQPGATAARCHGRTGGDRSGCDPRPDLAWLAARWRASRSPGRQGRVRPVRQMGAGSRVTFLNVPTGRALKLDRVSGLSLLP